MIPVLLIVSLKAETLSYQGLSIWALFAVRVIRKVPRVDSKGGPFSCVNK